MALVRARGMIRRRRAASCDSSPLVGGSIALNFMTKFQFMLFLGDFIVYAGDMGREMYCVRRGLVEVIGDDDFTVVATLGPGAYFGEVCTVTA